MQEHKKEDAIVCPNCGFSATRNYCAQCGQETHLHKETFWGLITHFVGHYFHYDSKFWVTLKTLFTKPGMLTVAYWEQKRKRYIPPISLYILVSVVFFFFFFSTVGTEAYIRGSLSTTEEERLTNAQLVDSLRKAALLTGDTSVKRAKGLKLMEIGSSPEILASIAAKVTRNVPKIFFFMIPLMAFILKILYHKRKGLHFGDHAIFSLHIHAFAFIMFFFYLYELPDVSANRNWLDDIIALLRVILAFGGFFYMVVAIHNAYKSSWVRSIIYGLVISASYAFFFLSVAIAYFLFVVYMSL